MGGGARLAGALVPGHHLGPFLGFRSDELAHVRGRHRHWHATEVRKARLNPGIGEADIDVLVEHVDNLGRRVLGRADPVKGIAAYGRCKFPSIADYIYIPHYVEMVVPKYRDEEVEFWLTKSKEELANIAAVMHRDRRAVREGEGYREVMAFRAAIATAFLKGTGVEVGAGSRPWPVPPNVSCFYGDSRDAKRLAEYFKDAEVKGEIKFDGFLDAQTFSSVADTSLDFVISAHVIEHLADPIGAIREAIRTLRPSGIHLLAVPDMRLTHDRNRPPTTLEHLLSDELDGGKGTRRQAYEEHARYVHTYYNPPIPEDEIDAAIDRIDAANMDLHWHAWTGETFRAMLHAIGTRFGFETIAHIPVQNQNIFVLRKAAQLHDPGDARPCC